MDLQVGDVVILKKGQRIWRSKEHQVVTLHSDKYVVIEQAYDTGGKWTVEARCLECARIPRPDFFVYRFAMDELPDMPVLRTISLSDAEEAMHGFENLVNCIANKTTSAPTWPEVTPALTEAPAEPVSAPEAPAPEAIQPLVETKASKRKPKSEPGITVGN